MRRFADLGAVGVGSVDEVDAELGGAAENLFRRFGSLGSPQIPSPVMRMAPKPRRWMVRSPPTEKVPLAVAFTAVVVVIPYRTLEVA